MDDTELHYIIINFWGVLGIMIIKMLDWVHIKILIVAMYFHGWKFVVQVPAHLIILYVILFYNGL